MSGEKNLPLPNDQDFPEDEPGEDADESESGEFTELLDEQYGKGGK